MIVSGESICHVFSATSLDMLQTNKTVDVD